MSDDSAPPRNTARIDENGPLVLSGRIRHARRDAVPSAQYTQVALCRCGASGNKPFCDDSHARIGFTDAGRCAKPHGPSDHAPIGELVIHPIANGPLRIDGWLDLATADGQRHVFGDKTWFCRCGASGSKPFCDGTHKKIGFIA